MDYQNQNEILEIFSFSSILGVTRTEATGCEHFNSAKFKSSNFVRTKLAVEWQTFVKISFVQFYVFNVSCE